MSWVVQIFIIIVMSGAANLRYDARKALYSRYLRKGISKVMAYGYCRLEHILYEYCTVRLPSPKIYGTRVLLSRQFTLR